METLKTNNLANSDLLMSKICLIDDEQNILDVLENFLEAKGHEVVSFCNPSTFFDNKDQLNDVAAFLVDWKLPEIEGTEIVKRIRDGNKYVPIFMLTACDSQEDIIKGIESGADDYITKPCNLKELYARLNNALVKYDSLNKVDKDLKVIEEGNLVMFKGNSVSLTSREFAIFKSLLDNEGKPVDRDSLLSTLDKDSQMIKRNVDVHVFSLRKKLNDISLKVVTVRGVGYKLERAI
jgi:DNA-binding response OmpR family regulator